MIDIELNYLKIIIKTVCLNVNEKKINIYLIYFSW